MDIEVGPKTRIRERTFVGSLVRLEPLELRHAEGLAAASAEDPTRYRWSPVPQGLHATRQYIETAIESREAGSCFPFAVLRLPDQTEVGSTRLWNLERWAWPSHHPDHGRPFPDACEIGYTWLARSAMRTGVNVETKLLLLSLAFDEWNVVRVCFHADVRNAVSRQSIEGIGGRFEGILRSHRLAVDLTPRDSARYSIVRSEWPGVKALLQGRLARSTDRRPLSGDGGTLGGVGDSTP